MICTRFLSCSTTSTADIITQPIFIIFLCLSFSMSRMPSYRSSTLSLSFSFFCHSFALVSSPTHVGNVVHPRIIPWLNWYIDILTELPMHEMITLCTCGEQTCMCCVNPMWLTKGCSCVVSVF
eukprot:596639_1